MIWVTFISLFFSAFFSGMEIAFFSCNKLKVEVDKKQGKYYAKVISRFFEKPGELLATLLMGNNVSIVIYGISFASVLNPILLQYVVSSMTGALIINLFISTTIVLITADFLPKVLCRMIPNGVLLRFTWLLSLFYVILFPLAKFTNMLSFFFLKIFGIKAAKHRERVLFNKSDLMVLSDEVENMQEDEAEHGNEVHIFRNALDFSEVTVRACMIPRNEMKMIEINDSFEELMNLFVETGFSRIPVYEHSVDHIVGYVHSKDLFVGIKSIQEMLRPLRFVPEDFRAQKLLAFMTKNKKSVAVVVDEFGGTSGMVTLEDLIEEIFGEIRDESDKEALVEQQLSEHEFIFSARLEIRYLNKMYDLNIPESDAYETLAGYITHQNEAIPKEQEEFQFEGIKFTIITTSPTRIETVNVRLLDEK